MAFGTQKVYYVRTCWVLGPVGIVVSIIKKALTPRVLTNQELGF